MAWERVLAAAAAIAFGLISAAEAEGPDVEGMIRMIPETQSTYGGWPAFGFVDLRALEAAAGLTPPASERDFAALPDAERSALVQVYRGAFVRPGGLIDYTGMMSDRSEAMIDAVGFDFFAVDTAAVFGDLPPRSVVILGGGPDLGDKSELEFSLPGRGYALSESEALPTWWRFGDGVAAVALSDRYSDGDPFDRDMMMSERIAFDPGVVIAAHFWDDLRQTLAVRARLAPAAALSEVLTPLVAASRQAAGPDAVLVQLAAFWLTHIGMTDPVADVLASLADGGNVEERLEALRSAGQTPARPLPPYPVALIADLAAGSERVAVIALPYAERAAAEAAAAVVAERLADWNPVPANDGRSSVATIGGTVSSSVTDSDGLATPVLRTFAGLAVWGAAADRSAAPATLPQIPEQPGGAIAVIVVRYPRPGADAPAWQTLPMLWTEAAINRAMAPLQVP